MTCGLHGKLDAAYSAAREAFDEAHKTDALADNDLNLLFVYYQGIKKLKESLPDHKHDEAGISISFDGISASDGDGCYDPDYNINLFNNDPLAGNLSFDTNFAADTVSIPSPVGEDIVTFSTSDSDKVITTAESEDSGPV